MDIIQGQSITVIDCPWIISATFQRVLSQSLVARQPVSPFCYSVRLRVVSLQASVTRSVVDMAHCLQSRCESETIDDHWALTQAVPVRSGFCLGRSWLVTTHLDVAFRTPRHTACHQVHTRHCHNWWSQWWSLCASVTYNTHLITISSYTVQTYRKTARNWQRNSEIKGSKKIQFKNRFCTYLQQINVD